MQDLKRAPARKHGKGGGEETEFGGLERVDTRELLAAMSAAVESASTRLKTVGHVAGCNACSDED